MQAISDKLEIKKKNQCMKAFGNMQFCDCIVDKIPISIDFVQYVAIVSGTKDDFKYDSMSAEDKKVFDSTRQAGDACVQWRGKVEKQQSQEWHPTRVTQMPDRMKEMGTENARVYCSAPPATLHPERGDECRYWFPDVKVEK